MGCQRIQVIDSHTGGEPTRVVIDGGPPLTGQTPSELVACFRERFDHYRRALIHEPRGSEVLVGALLYPPLDTSCTAGVIFFNNVGYLGMCGHGTIGVGVTLGWLGRITPGSHRLETPVGCITFEYDGHRTVALENVPSYRYVRNVVLTVEELGMVVGDVAWGGNWFFLVKETKEQLTADNVERLRHVTTRIKEALQRQEITGENGAEIDHIELFGPPGSPENHSRNFVLCPGNAYDRSPCGTGTSAKIACLAADGKLEPGAPWRQESIVGSVFTGSYRREGASIIPRIGGQAFITAETSIIVDDEDPLAWGMQ